MKSAEYIYSCNKYLVNAYYKLSTGLEFIRSREEALALLLGRRLGKYVTSVFIRNITVVKTYEY